MGRYCRCVQVDLVQQLRARESKTGGVAMIRRYLELKLGLKAEGLVSSKRLRSSSEPPPLVRAVSDMPGMHSPAPDQADRKCSEVLQNRRCCMLRNSIAGLRFIAARQAAQYFFQEFGMLFVHGLGATCHVKYEVPCCPRVLESSRGPHPFAVFS